MIFYCIFYFLDGKLIFNTLIKKWSYNGHVFPLVMKTSDVFDLCGCCYRQFGSNRREMGSRWLKPTKIATMHCTATLILTLGV
jgi:hypothetical protein